MSDALPLPDRPDLESYQTLAEEFRAACQSRDAGWGGTWLERWPETTARRMLREVESRDRCTLEEARELIARLHGFASWPKFARHVTALGREDSAASNFEAAAEAVVRGDAETLGRLLNGRPELARARSTREHRSTLLHYVSANGVEDFRQKTPPNIVEIAALLLKAGADVHAESDAYGGGSTTLGLTATSCHPERAGVQIALMELLLEHGAKPDGVNACLHNGRGQAAEFLASRGAGLDLEGAAGVGRLDIVESFFHPDGTLKPDATTQQMADGFVWACEFGRSRVAEFLLDRAFSPLPCRNGQTGLHWAAYGGHADIVKMLLDRQAPLNVKDEMFGGTPLAWAMHAMRNEPGAEGPGRYQRVIALLKAAGAVEE